MSLEEEPPVTAEVRSERGGPRLFLNDDEKYPLFVLSRQLPETLPNFKQSGIRFIQPVLGARSCWHGPDDYDWSLFDNYLTELLEQYPDAYFLPRFKINTPNWWKEAHPDELIEYGLEYNEDRYNLVEKEPLTKSPGGHYFGSGAELWEASFASEPWRRDTAKMIRAYMEHVENSPFNSRIIGYHVTTGTTGEWHNFGARQLPGYEPPMHRRVGDIPDPADRMETTHGLLRDPAVEKDVIEYYRSYHEAIAEAICQMGEAVKTGSNGRALFGTFFNYLVENVWIQEAGHLAPSPVLESPAVDFLASPYAYQSTNIDDEESWESDIVDGAGNWLGRARGVGGDCGYRIPVESANRHGKLFIVELDPSTYRAPEPLGEGGSGSDTKEGTLKILQRDLGKLFASGDAGWLYDFGLDRNAEVGWYSGEPILQTINDFVKLGERRSTLNIGSVAETAAVYSAESFFATQHWNAEEGHSDFFNRWFLDSQSRTLHRLGAPFDQLYDFDFGEADLATYELVCFINLFYLDERSVDRLRNRLAGSDLTVIWYYAPGFIGETELSIETMERLTGMEFSELTEPGPMMIQLGDRIGGELAVQEFGSDAVHWPRFEVTDSEATELGTWIDRSDAVALARKEIDGWESFYTGTAPLPAQLLRWIAREASVKLWSDQPDVITASDGAAMITATEAGERTLEFPQPMVEWGQETAAQQVDLSLDFGEVKIFTT